MRSGSCLAALAMVPVLITACSQSSTAAPPPASWSASPTPAQTIARGGNRCATAQLQFRMGPTNAATGNDIATVSITNRSATACYLAGYAGVQLLDGSGRRLQDATWTTDSFFGSYPPPHRVDIAPGGSSSFDLTWGGIDPCGNAPAQHSATMKITPPDEYDSTTIPADMIICPDSLAVHPVGSHPQQ